MSFSSHSRPSYTNQAHLDNMFRYSIELLRPPPDPPPKSSDNSFAEIGVWPKVLRRQDLRTTARGSLTCTEGKCTGADVDQDEVRLFVRLNHHAAQLAINGTKAYSGVWSPPATGNPSDASWKGGDFYSLTAGITIEITAEDESEPATWTINLGVRGQENPPPPDTSKPEVSLSASPTRVREGGTVTLTASLSQALASDSVTIQLALDQGTTLGSDLDRDFIQNGITIPAGQTRGTTTIQTYADEDTDDESFTVWLHEVQSSSVRVGNPPDSVVVTIVDGASSPPPVRPPPVDPPVEEGPIMLDLLDYYYDPDGDDLLMTFDTELVHETVPNVIGMHLDGSIWTIDALNVGIATVRVRACDVQELCSDWAQFTVEVVPAPNRGYAMLWRG